MSAAYDDNEELLCPIPPSPLKPGVKQAGRRLKCAKAAQVRES